jgi:hypothetical protein
VISFLGATVVVVAVVLHTSSKCYYTRVAQVLLNYERATTVVAEDKPMQITLNLNDIAFMIGATAICVSPVLFGLWFFATYQITKRNK